jgi:hypothetical protein
MNTVIVVANAFVALLSGVSALAGARWPGLGLAKGEAVTAGVAFYARAYTVRAFPLSVLALVELARQDWAVVGPLLIVRGAAQVGDSVLGVRQRNAGMAIGAGVGAVIHLASALWVL